MGLWPGVTTVRKGLITTPATEITAILDSLNTCTVGMLEKSLHTGVKG